MIDYQVCFVVCPTTLHAQLSTFKVMMKGVDSECFDDILSAIQLLNVDERQFIDLVVTLCTLIHVIQPLAPVESVPFLPPGE